MNNSYENKLLTNWESIFQQGLLTFWVFISLAESELDVSSIKKQVEKLTNNTYSATEQALYRLLRKQYDLELVDYREVAGSAGPNKKVYCLSPLGRRLLELFAQRNISLFHQKNVTELLKKG